MAQLYPLRFFVEKLKEYDMYIIKTKATFDSAHFLKGYDGKCANIHGHRWTVTIEAQSEEVEKEGPFRGMVVDFGSLIILLFMKRAVSVKRLKRRCLRKVSQC